MDLLIGSWLFERAHRDADGLLAIAVDGKVLRGAWTADNGQLTLFSAMIHGVGVTVAQIRVPDATNEITQVDTLLAGVPVGTSEHVISPSMPRTRNATQQSTCAPNWALTT